MRRFTLASAVAAVALTVAIPLSAHAGPAAADADDADDAAIDTGRRVAPAADHVEALRLGCGVREADAGPVVGCRWSAPTSPRAVGVVLWRFDRASDVHREVVFRTGDLGVTEFVDVGVRPGHRYAYVVQAVDRSGRVVGESRPVPVEVPKPPEVEVLDLACELGPAHEAIACTWSSPTSRDAYVITLWRSVDGGSREVVERFRPSGPNEYRDRVPAGASKVVYAVIATDEGDRIVARSRPATVRIPDPVDVAPARPAVPVPADPARPARPIVVDDGPPPTTEPRPPAELPAGVLRLIRELAAL